MWLGGEFGKIPYLFVNNQKVYKEMLEFEIRGINSQNQNDQEQCDRDRFITLLIIQFIDLQEL